MDHGTGLTLYYHPFASFCQKVLIALYENEIPFKPHLVDLGDPSAREAFRAIWPIGRFPVLGDAERGRVVPESTTIIEYLAVHYPGPSRAGSRRPRSRRSRCGSATGSSTSTSTSRCRRSSPTASAPRAATTRSASRRRGGCSPPPTG